ncbi:GNAT family N-acetyltransferase [Devosia sp. FJ2-5-3]|uniref:GNAT family N-acetyltransferase n=1 Tax=Devosia sp. FJ2-5-3 TaxID=2976680 RepID=UPI0023D7D030|nr:GNAT family N-acetyltransferase [Devosia sp. FJ2-5-3]WEJ59539.1 GNAT family N-acetyltransferase [Devosia sp. FJ2-5-3]
MMLSHPGAAIRSGVIDDFPVLVDLQRRASLAGYPEPVRSVLAANPALVDQSFRPEWFSGDQVRVAIDAEEGIAGFAVLARSGDETELVALFVDPGHWKRGIGRSLVEAAATLASRWVETEIFVLANPLALGFYTSVGFVHDRYVDMRNAPAVPRMILKIPRPLSADD